MEKIVVNGISLAFRRLGTLSQGRSSLEPYPTTGAPLILVHGFPLDGSVWHLIEDKLADHFDVLMPDLRGFGGSDAPVDGTTVEQMASDLATMLDLLNLPQAYIAGHSMGGYVSLAFAHAYPEKVLGLALIGSQAAPDSPERKAGRYATAEQVAAQGPQVVLGMADKLTADPKFAPMLREVILRQPANGLIGGLKAMAERPDASAFLLKFGFPVAFVHGLADALIPPERSREMKALLPNAELVELPGIGHSPFLEAPDETAQVLINLLDK